MKLNVKMILKNRISSSLKTVPWKPRLGNLYIMLSTSNHWYKFNILIPNHPIIHLFKKNSKSNNQTVKLFKLYVISFILLIAFLFYILKGTCSCVCSSAAFSGPSCSTATGTFTVDPSICNSLPSSDCSINQVVGYCPNKCFCKYQFFLLFVTHKIKLLYLLFYFYILFRLSTIQ